MRIKRTLFSFVFLFLLSSLFFGSGLQEKKVITESRSALDALNRVVTVNNEIDKILVIGRAAIMPSDALYFFPSVLDKEVLLATTDQGLGDFFTLIRSDLTKEKRLAQQLSAEEIVALKPDLVITKSNNYDSIGKQLEKFGIPLFVMDLESPQAWKDEIVQLGILLNDNETPKSVASNFQKREEFISKKLSTLSEDKKPTVLLLQVASSDGATAFSVAPKDWIQAYLVENSHAVPIWLDSPFSSNAWSKVSFEQIAKWDADYIFLINYRGSVNSFLKEIENSSHWHYLSAFKKGNIRAFAADFLNWAQSDSRSILALQWLAATLHPNVFTDFDIEKEIASFYADFYNIKDATIIDKLIESFYKSVNYEKL